MAAALYTHSSTVAFTFQVHRNALCPLFGEFWKTHFEPLQQAPFPTDPAGALGLHSCPFPTQFGAGQGVGGNVIVLGGSVLFGILSAPSNHRRKRMLGPESEWISGLT